MDSRPAAHRATPFEKVVGTRLALYLNIETGRLDPTQYSIAKDVDAGERTVRRAIATLVARGFLAKTRRGSERSDFYRLKTPRPAKSGQSDCGRPARSGQSDRPTVASRKAKRKADRERAQVRANSTPRAPYGAREKEKAITKATWHRAFDWLWKEYDRGYLDDPEPARQAFMAACQAGNDPEAILRGAKAYMDAKEPCFRRKLEEWLGRRGWTKPPPKPKSASTRTFTQKVDPGKNMQGLAERLRAERLAREAAGK